MIFSRRLLAAVALGSCLHVRASGGKGLLAKKTSTQEQEPDFRRLGTTSFGNLALTPCEVGKKPKGCDPWDYEDHCPFQGLLPIFEGEKDLPNIFRLALYLMGLGYTFLGIAIISDVFMAGIEKVTSWKKRVKDKETGRTVTVYIWNATVANLTLMALGSSAPEILLSLIEIVQNEMFLGDLGAGTIVGSAAFNLLVISAVCVMAIPEPDVRYIKQTTVYAITATCSVLAYGWLMFILMVTSPNVCTKTEALATLFFCPAMVVAAFLADKGFFSRSSPEKSPVHTIPDDVTPDELAMIEQQIRETHGSELSAEQVVNIMTAKYFTNRSRAYYRQIGGKMARAGPKRKASFVQKLTKSGAPDLTVNTVLGTSDNLKNDKQDNKVILGFESARYAFLEDCGHALVYLQRAGPANCRATVKYKTRDGTAKSTDDYEPVDGVMVFEPEEMRKVLKIKIFDDNAYEENEEFYVDLSDPSVEESAENPGCQAQLSDINSVIVVIIDDDDPGTVRWKVEEVEVVEEVQGGSAELVIERIGGASGKITCKYETEDLNAIAGADYEYTTGRVELGPAVQSTTIQVPIKPKGRFEKTSSFIVKLSDAVGCVFDKDTDGGEESCICCVTIKGKTCEERTNVIKRMTSKINSQQAMLGHRHWRQQFSDALFKVKEDDDDDDDEDDDDDAKKEEGSHPSKMDYVMHVISLPWKVLFALVPPTDYCGGWACFCVSLLMIAVVTALVGDMANLVGCCLKIKPEITAITFVALGTSLPDTFASKTAAMMDPYADASIGNITGSNSVNVFIGLGLSWTLAAFYWSYQKPTQQWLDKVFSPCGDYYDIREDISKVASDGYAVFVTPTGTIWFNLMVFSCNAFFAIQHLFARRKKFGGELGGPLWGVFGQYFSATFLVFQWVIYLVASSIWASIQTPKGC